MAPCVGVEEITMATIKNNDLNAEETLSDAQAKDVKGGIALLLPAVQSAREAARSKDQSTSVESKFVRR